MNTENFKLIKNIEVASEMGLDWFSNGSAKQAVYTLFFDGKPIKSYISANANKKLYALVEIGHKAVNGVAIVPNIEIIYQIKFSVKPNKKTIGIRKIVVTD